MTTIAGYKATRDPKGVLTIHDVPIFLECERGDFEADREWIAAAFQRAQQQAQEGYFPPLHIRHHDIGVDPERAGFFRIVRVGPLVYRGRSRLTLFADLVLTDEWAQFSVLEHRLPYRSVEIYDPEKPEISSLALLDTEAPYLQLPMLMVDDVDDHGAEPHASVAFAAFDNPLRADRFEERDALVVCFSQGAEPFLIGEESEHMTVTKSKAASAAPKGRAAKTSKPAVKLQDGDDKKDGDDDGEKMEGDGESKLDVDAVCKAVESGEISLADMKKLLAAVEAQMGDGEPEAEEEDTDAPAPAMAPGAESMSAKPGESVKFAEMQAEIDALKLQQKERDDAEQRREDVGTAVRRLEGRALGADFPAELEKFHQDHGREPFLAYVDALAAKLGAAPDSSGAAERFGVQPQTVPESAQKFQAEGADRVRMATELAMQFRELSKRRKLLSTEAEFVEQNMPPLETA